jgi:hypothetical protein
VVRQASDVSGIPAPDPAPIAVIGEKDTGFLEDLSDGRHVEAKPTSLYSQDLRRRSIVKPIDKVRQVSGILRVDGSSRKDVGTAGKAGVAVPANHENLDAVGAISEEKDGRSVTDFRSVTGFRSVTDFHWYRSREGASVKDLLQG